METGTVLIAKLSTLTLKDSKLVLSVLNVDLKIVKIFNDASFSTHLNSIHTLSALRIIFSFIVSVGKR